MNRPRLYYCDHHHFPLPAAHRFPQSKYRLVRDLLEQHAVFDFVPAAAAPVDAVERVHDPAYVRAFLDGSLPLPAMRRIGFPWSPELVRRTLASAGGTLAASADALASGFGGNLAGGTHHAFRAEGAGYCVFHDIAIAVEHLRATLGLRRAAVVDLDVHQGDGSAAIFAGDPDVLTLSLHGRNNFPFRKQESVIDIAFDDHAGDEEYLARLEEALPAVVRFRPEIVFYQSGVDALKEDTLGRLDLTHDGLRRRDEMVFTLCLEQRFPVVVTLGGGYASPIENTARAHANTYLAAAAVFNLSSCAAASRTLP